MVTTVDEYAVGPDRGILTGKLYEAIELARHVLIFSAANSDVREVVRAIPYARCFTGNQAEAMAEWLDNIAYTFTSGLHKAELLFMAEIISRLCSGH